MTDFDFRRQPLSSHDESRDESHDHPDARARPPFKPERGSSEPHALFFVEFWHDVDPHGTVARRTRVDLHEGMPRVKARSIPGFDVAAAAQWIQEVLLMSIGDPGATEAIPPETGAHRVDRDREVHHRQPQLVVTTVRVSQPPDPEGAIAMPATGEQRVTSLYADAPFAISVDFRIDWNGSHLPPDKRLEVRFLAKLATSMRMIPWGVAQATPHQEGSSRWHARLVRGIAVEPGPVQLIIAVRTPITDEPRGLADTGIVLRMLRHRSVGEQRTTRIAATR